VRERQEFFPPSSFVLFFTHFGPPPPFLFLHFSLTLSRSLLPSKNQKSNTEKHTSGPGDFLGAKQSGWGVVSQGLRAARLPDDIELMPRAREAALVLMEALPPFQGAGDTSPIPQSPWMGSLARAVEAFEERAGALSAAAEAALGSRKGGPPAAAAPPAAPAEPKKGKRVPASAAAKKAPAAAAREPGAVAPRGRGRPRKSEQQQQQ